MLSWVVGSGGLLGSSLTDVVGPAFESQPIPWRQTDRLASAFAAAASRFADEAESGSWAVYWAAGSAVVASDPSAMAAEVEPLRAFLSALTECRPPGPGAVFLASSAGGVYAGSAHPPFDAYTRPMPLGAYGALKLRQEEIARESLDGTVPLVVGRIANLYGPRQNPLKPQGLIYQLCRAAAHRRALNLYVSMETMRDYIYADDAAAMIRAHTEAALGTTATASVQVVASGRSVSIAELVGTLTRVTHRKVPIALGQHPTSGQQVIDLRLLPSPLPEGVHLEPTDLATGIRRTFNAVVRQPQPV